MRLLSNRLRNPQILCLTNSVIATDVMLPRMKAHNISWASSCTDPAVLQIVKALFSHPVVRRPTSSSVMLSRCQADPPDALKTLHEKALRVFENKQDWGDLHAEILSRGVSASNFW